MKTLGRLVLIAAIAVAGVFGFSYVRNPDLGPVSHASAIGNVLSAPLSVAAWRGLACPHRKIVTDLVTKSLGPRMCGLPSDGGARARALRFQSQGPESCWTLYERLNAQAESRFSTVLEDNSRATPASKDVCRQAKELIKAG